MSQGEYGGDDIEEDPNFDLPGPIRPAQERRRRRRQILESTTGDAPTPPDLNSRMLGIERRMESMLEMMNKQNDSPTKQVRSRPSTSTPVDEIKDVDRGSARLAGFTRLKPPTFSGQDDTDPLYFLSELEKRYDVQRCSDKEMVAWSKFQLVGLAYDWAKSELEDDITWEEFKEAFVERFIPESIREEKAQSFLELKQDHEMSVTDYERKFVDLSRFAPEHVSTKKKKIKRFVRGLIAPIKRSLVSLKHKTFGAAVDNTRHFKRISIKEKAEEEDEKKSKYGVSGSRSKTSSRDWQHRKSTSNVQTSSSTSRYLPRSYSTSTGNPFGPLPGQLSRSYITSVPQPHEASPSYRQRMTSGGQSSQQGFTSPRDQNRICQSCGRSHRGTVCYRTTGVCYECGGSGHMIKDCPSQPSASSSRVNLSSPPARASNIMGSRGRNNQAGHAQGGRGFGREASSSYGRGQTSRVQR